MKKPEQIEMFATTATTPSTSIAGITIRLAGRPSDPNHRRCGDLATIGSSRGIHWAVLTCATCGKHRGWLGRDAINFINETRARFGAPEIITLRTPSTSPAQAARAPRSAAK
jgi:hypothetical protein